MSSNCDWPDAFCDDGENWTSTCIGCGRWLRVCDYHYGYHIMFAVLGHLVRDAALATSPLRFLTCQHSRSRECYSRGRGNGG